jgi:hypothetical protein
MCVCFGHSPSCGDCSCSLSWPEFELLLLLSPGRWLALHTIAHNMPFLIFGKPLNHFTVCPASGSVQLLSVDLGDLVPAQAPMCLLQAMLALPLHPCCVGTCNVSTQRLHLCALVHSKQLQSMLVASVAQPNTF